MRMYLEERIHLIIELTRASSCNWSLYFSSGCINGSHTAFCASSQGAHGFDADLQVANEKLGQLETTQIETNTKLTALETSVAGINTSLAALVRRFDDLNAGDGNQR